MDNQVAHYNDGNALMIVTTLAIARRRPVNIQRNNKLNFPSNFQLDGMKNSISPFNVISAGGGGAQVAFYVHNKCAGSSQRFSTTRGGVSSFTVAGINDVVSHSCCCSSRRELKMGLAAFVSWRIRINGRSDESHRYNLVKVSFSVITASSTQGQLPLCFSLTTEHSKSSPEMFASIFTLWTLLVYSSVAENSNWIGLYRDAHFDELVLSLRDVKHKPVTTCCAKV
ncbi:hypothetical protein GQ600_2824 [Phytophthora cactorum]|nr:hypothetical protein GQ600_2824 [Phytophthora cactorum]